MKFNSQNEALLHYLKNHIGITTWEAVEKLGITSLSKRICELQDIGIKIDKIYLDGTNRYGNACKVIRYQLGQ